MYLTKYAMNELQKLVMQGMMLRNSPHRQGKFVHNCGHGHKRQCQPCTSATALAGSHEPWALQMYLQVHSMNLMSTPAHGGQEKSTMAVSGGPLI
jgi:hypothetical protein